MKVSFYTLGCKVNQSETKKISAQFEALGYVLVDFGTPADVIVINTCSVTHIAERKSRNMIRRALKNSPHAKLYVCGCYVNLESAKLKIDIPEIYRLIPQEDKMNLGKWDLPEMTPPSSSLPATAERESRVRSFIKVQDGCDQYCSYCIVAHARPVLVSTPLNEIITEATAMLRAGVTELIVTGINVGKHEQLIAVIKELLKLPGLQRLRLSSIEPNLITHELIDLIAAEPKMAKHLHIPLQSGSNKILNAMERRYSLTDYTKMIQYIREKIAPIGITTDLIVGFPGENQETAAETLETLHKLKFSDMHIFTYSPRPGTKAYAFPHILSDRHVNAAFEKITAENHRCREQFKQTLLNKPVELLLEKKLKYGYEGLTSEYCRVIWVTGEALPLGSIQKVVPTGITTEAALQRQLPPSPHAVFVD
jgi:threonylcarbamoyladenosine tRNA methylthiotransferase MtaB